MPDPPSLGCYKCGARDHVATNRNCPRPRGRTTDTLTPLSTPAPISPLSPPFGRTRASRKVLQLTDESFQLQNHGETGPKDNRARFWYYDLTPQGPRAPVREAPESLATDEKDERHDFDSTHDDPCASQPTENKKPRTMSMNEYAHRLRIAPPPAIVSKNQPNPPQLESPTKHRKSIPASDSSPEIEPSAKHRRSIPTSNTLSESEYPLVRKSGAEPSRRKHPDMTAEISSSQPQTNLSLSGVNHGEDLASVSPVVKPKKSKRSRQNNMVDVEKIKPRASRRKKPPKAVSKSNNNEDKTREPPANATWGELFEWYDLPQNDEFSAAKRKNVSFNYISNRNNVDRPNAVLWGRHLQGWRECRSTGRGLGQHES
ncbi:hypothetical protein EX30DRAFT_339792 [Ascodesmis nigricans]|uniref:Uncharacterized protein n=1 Tax=Ascodesmis nigricans TaxID=341454 RepID=A0A4S2N0H0_9PEZI|nr:hypothetical protein EX30DRAFT_339792 [Ascodesmis nigricans]